MKREEDNSKFFNSCFFSISLCIIFCAAAFSVYFLLPTEKEVEHEEIKIIAEIIEDEEEEIVEETLVSQIPNYSAEVEPTFVSYLNDVSIGNIADYVDDGLMLYREDNSRSAVEWFYTHVTGNREVASAILAAADRNDIPLSLAFALAYTESRYNVNAVNDKNENRSIDRGLFQLNSNSFPALSEEDFFNPEISAKYGMSHLKFCLDTAGNPVSALAMYNAGTGKVRSGKTPQSTLNYINKIISYQEMIEKLFDDEVCSYFEPRIENGVSVALANKN